MGEVVNVAGGFARNYLIPRGLAVGVTRGRMKEIEEQKKVLEVKAARQREQVEAVAERITARKVVIKARCSASGKLFGSITNRQLASAVEELTGEEIDRHKIVIDDRVRSVGPHHALVKLHPDVELDLEFEVEGEGFVTEEPASEETEVQASAAPEGSGSSADEGAPSEAVAEEGGESADEGAPTEAVAEEAGESLEVEETGEPQGE